jgi:hypothetical protein
MGLHDPNNIYCDNKYDFLYEILFIYEIYDSYSSYYYCYA